MWHPEMARATRNEPLNEPLPETASVLPEMVPTTSSFVLGGGADAYIPARIESHSVSIICSYSERVIGESADQATY